MKKIFIDIETYSSVDLLTSGVYKYAESPDFEILMLAYAIDDEPSQILDLALGEKLPVWLAPALRDPEVEKHAHNANFERICLRAYGLDVPIEQWYCTAVKAGYCGLPLSLDGASKALKLGDKGKSAEGKSLIAYFSCPVKPTKANGGRTRNLSHHDPEKWARFLEYCKKDVEAERTIDKLLERYEIPSFERRNYILDQKINDRGILVDLDFAQKAKGIDDQFSAELLEALKRETGLDNPNSPTQLKKWLGEKLGAEVKSVAKGSVSELLAGRSVPEVERVLRLRQMGAKTSTKKYVSMLACTCQDERAHGLFQFYGANRTGRWAGRLIQMQNLPRNKTSFLDQARAWVKTGDYDFVSMMVGDVPDMLSQLIRTAFVAKPGHTFAVADFSAIEARVIAWLSGELWRIKVFNTHGKIYEASASTMFNVPIETVTKGSSLRDKGKIAELALGYQGSVGALKTMGGESMGLSESEMASIVSAWRRANPAIVQLWKDIEGCALRSLRTRKKVASIHKGLVFEYDGQSLSIRLPSGRKLFYRDPIISANGWGADCIRYMGMNQETKQWELVDTYGGKLVENIVQAIARDLLADAMRRLDRAGFEIVMHVHDEAVIEIEEHFADETLEVICEIMGEALAIYDGVPIPAEGYLTPYYKKD